MRLRVVNFNREKTPMEAVLTPHATIVAQQRLSSGKVPSEGATLEACRGDTLSASRAGLVDR
jgi:hypothetical protein